MEPCPCHAHAMSLLVFSRAGLWRVRQRQHAASREPNKRKKCTKTKCTFLRSALFLAPISYPTNAQSSGRPLPDPVEKHAGKNRLITLFWVIPALTSYFNIPAGIHSVFRAFYLTFYLTFFLASILTFCLTFFLAFYLTFLFRASIVAFYLAFFLALTFCLAFYLTFFQTFFLTFCLVSILAFSLAFYLASVRTFSWHCLQAIWCSAPSVPPTASGARHMVRKDRADVFRSRSRRKWKGTRWRRRRGGRKEGRKDGWKDGRRSFTFVKRC